MEPLDVTAPARLTIAVSTLGSRLPQIDVEALPARPGWRYLMLVQAAELPAALPVRPDIDWLRLEGVGVAASRNCAIDAAATEYLLFCDDDIQLLPDGVARLVAAFDARPGIAIVTAQTLGEDGVPLKAYPRRAQRLGLFNSAKTGTVEMMVRPARIRQHGVRFDTDYGAGASLPLGEEYIFIAACLRAGLAGRYVPVPIATHCGASSGSDWLSPAIAEARARVLEGVFGRLAVPVKLLFFAKHFGSLRATGGLRVYWRAMFGARR